MVDLIIFIVIIFLGMFFGRRIEKRHYKTILEREEKYKDIVVLSDKDLKNFESSLSNDTKLITEGTVVSIDSFKKLMSSFVNIFGGRMKAYETLVDRARREAVLKVKQNAHDNGYNTLINLRLETSSISKNARKSVGSVEAFAYATAISLPKVGK